MSLPPDDGPGTPEPLARLRAEIERVDGELVRLIGQRVQLARRVGAVKRSAGMPALDPEREATVLARAGETARRLGIPADQVRALFEHIIEMSRRAQDAGG